MTQEGKKPDTSESIAKELMTLFLGCGYVRRLSRARRKSAGSRLYRKGNEVRLVLRHPGELLRARRLLELVGLTPGAAFRKHSRYIQPVYGPVALAWFVSRLPRGAERLAAGFTASAARRFRRLPVASIAGAGRQSRPRSWPKMRSETGRVSMNSGNRAGIQDEFTVKGAGRSSFRQGANASQGERRA